MDLVAIAQNSMERRRHQSHCHDCVDAATYNIKFNSTGAMLQSPERMHDAHIAQRLPIKHGYGLVHVQHQVEFKKTIIYRRLMMQKQLCPRTSVMKFNNIGQCL